MAKKLIMTVGLPRSGKTRYTESFGNRPVVCPNDIRLALTGQRFYGPSEPMVWAIAKTMVRTLFVRHDVVILDATNGTRARRDEWRSSEWKREMVEFRVDPEECKRRAHVSGREDLIPVIERMANNWEWPTKEERDEG